MDRRLPQPALSGGDSFFAEGRGWDRGTIQLLPRGGRSPQSNRGRGAWEIFVKGHWLLPLGDAIRPFDRERRQGNRRRAVEDGLFGPSDRQLIVAKSHRELC
jgi:hypothetical protein